MPRWDFKCPDCGHVDVVSYPSLEAAESDPPICMWHDFDDNPPVMQRQPASGSFIVKGYSAKNGYGK